MPDTIPPLTTDDVRAILQDPTFSVYIYIGAANSLGWRNAELAHTLIPRLRIYRCVDRDTVALWTGNDPDIFGIVFGFDEVPAVLLGEVEVEDARLVLLEILDARK